MSRTTRRFDGDWQDDHVYAEIRSKNYLHFRSYYLRHITDEEEIRSDNARQYDWDMRFRERQRRGMVNDGTRKKNFRKCCASECRSFNRRGYHTVMRGDDDEIDNIDWHGRKHGKAHIWDFW